MSWMMVGRDVELMMEERRGGRGGRVVGICSGSCNSLSVGDSDKTD
jgi:hypothetical protein